jgi:hypothetical protein
MDLTRWRPELSTGWPGVLGARVLDRLGSGARSAPRDALVAASADTPAAEGHSASRELAIMSARSWDR